VSVIVDRREGDDRRNGREYGGKRETRDRRRQALVVHQFLDIGFGEHTTRVPDFRPWAMGHSRPRLTRKTPTPFPGQHWRYAQLRSMIVAMSETKPVRRMTIELIPDFEAGGFTARLPDIPAYGEGKTEAEAIADLKEALRGYIETFGLDDARAQLSSPFDIRELDWDLNELARG
jgi:predicted RNase H-like HicB family nuclease